MYERLQAVRVRRWDRIAGAGAGLCTVRRFRCSQSVYAAKEESESGCVWRRSLFPGLLLGTGEERIRGLLAYHLYFHGRGAACLGTFQGGSSVGFNCFYRISDYGTGEVRAGTGGSSVCLYTYGCSLCISGSWLVPSAKRSV